MKKCLTLLLVCLIMLGCVMPAYAAGGNVTYRGKSSGLVFAPGSEFSPTDLFPNFKDVMPGDGLVQQITVRNDASNKVKVKIYLRALGAHPDSEAFLSQLRLRVDKSAENSMAHMFDAAASESAQLTDWVCLGTLYSGGEVNLNVILFVPPELDNAYQKQIGYLDWEFMVEEFDIDPNDPEPPKTGDDAQIGLWLGVMCGSLVAVLLLLLILKRKNKEEE